LSHLGISTNLPQYRNLKISLLNNPSHLEAINPVAMGKTKSKLQAGKNAVCFLIHGDTAFTGQGIVSESLGLANLPHFKTSNTLQSLNFYRWNCSFNFK
jgi:probable 2-oxoglutarate dehydrogenase E1 component DHKTD1